MGMGEMPHSHFPQDSAQDFFEIDEKIIRTGIVAYLHKSGGRGQKIFSYALHFYDPGHALAQG